MKSNLKGNPALVDGVDYGQPLESKVEAQVVDNVHKLELVDDKPGKICVPPFAVKLSQQTSDAVMTVCTGVIAVTSIPL